MPQIPTLPLSVEAKELLSFVTEFITLPGFVAVYEQKLKQLGDGYGSKLAAYEATEQLYQELFGLRKYNDVQTFMPALCRYRNTK